MLCLLRRELEWLFEDKGGANMVYPDYFEEYRNFIPRVSISIYYPDCLEEYVVFIPNGRTAGTYILATLKSAESSFLM